MKKDYYLFAIQLNKFEEFTCVLAIFFNMLIKDILVTKLTL